MPSSAWDTGFTVNVDGHRRRSGASDAGRDHVDQRATDWLVGPLQVPWLAVVLRCRESRLRAGRTSVRPRRCCATGAYLCTGRRDLTAADADVRGCTFSMHVKAAGLARRPELGFRASQGPSGQLGVLLTRSSVILAGRWVADLGFRLVVAGVSGYWSCIGMVALRSSNARRWVGVAMVSKSKPAWS